VRTLKECGTGSPDWFGRTEKTLASNIAGQPARRLSYQPLIYVMALLEQE
jgi:hypothetical protein